MLHNACVKHVPLRNNLMALLSSALFNQLEHVLTFLLWCTPCAVQVCQGVFTTAEDPNACQHHTVEWRFNNDAWQPCSHGAHQQPGRRLLLTAQQPHEACRWHSECIKLTHVKVCCIAARPQLGCCVCVSQVVCQSSVGVIALRCIGA